MATSGTIEYDIGSSWRFVLPARALRRRDESRSPGSRRAIHYNGRASPGLTAHVAKQRMGQPMHATQGWRYSVNASCVGAGKPGSANDPTATAIASGLPCRSQKTFEPQRGQK